jgi:ribosomal protein L29
MNTLYETDVVAWANEQAGLIRAGRYSELDVTHIAEEIEDVGKSEQRELLSRMVVLLAHLLKWQFQPSKQSKSWQHTLRTQRKDVAYALSEAPSLRTKFKDAQWLDIVWAKAKSQAETETGLDIDAFPENCPWAIEDILREDWLPSASAH